MIEIVDDQEFLQKYQERWSSYHHGMKYVNNIFRYLVRGISGVFHTDLNFVERPFYS